MQIAPQLPQNTRSFPPVFLTGMVVIVSALQLPGAVLTQTSSPDGFAHFTYDRGVSLDVKQNSVKVRDGATIQDITYTGSNGDTVPAYLVIPKGSGKFAGVIWGHWLMPGASNSNREEFLDEAVALAPAGVVSLLIDAPKSRPNFKQTPNPVLVTQQVIDLRRGLDLLLSRSDIDPSRIAYVGHSWDAGVGAILDAIDKRFAAFVFMSGPQSMTKRILSSPDMAALRKSNDTAEAKKVEDSLKADAWADPGTYTSKLGPAPALFQYALHDEKWVPLASAKDYAAEASEPKTVEFYDADHSFNAKARMDRDSFLRKTLKLTQ
jgi:dienelactone hydrolase